MYRHPTSYSSVAGAHRFYVISCYDHLNTFEDSCNYNTSSMRAAHVTGTYCFKSGAQLFEFCRSAVENFEKTAHEPEVSFSSLSYAPLMMESGSARERRSTPVTESVRIWRTLRHPPLRTSNSLPGKPLPFCSTSPPSSATRALALCSCTDNALQTHPPPSGRFGHFSPAHPSLLDPPSGPTASRTQPCGGEHSRQILLPP